MKTTKPIKPIICRLSRVSASDLAAIEQECNSPPWSARLFAQEFSNRCAFVYGARVEGHLTGFLVAHVVIDGAHIVNFGVAHKFRRRGIGQALMSYALNDFHDMAVRQVTLEARKSNMAARALYERLGFQEVALRSAYYSNDLEDGVIMNLDLCDFMSSQTSNAKVAANG